MEKVIAKLRFLKITPRKVRLVADLVRGKKVEDARAMLKVLNKRSAKPILKLIDSAVANAKHNFNLKEEGLKIEAITVDDGPTLKRWMPKAMGRATTIRKRSSHIIITLFGEIDQKNKKESKNKEKKEEVKKEETEKVDVKKRKVLSEKDIIKKTDIKKFNSRVANVSQVSKPRKMGSRSK